MTGIYRHSGFPSIMKVVACLLIITFISQDIIWAYPDIISTSASDNNKLAPAPFTRRPESPEKAVAKFIQYAIEDNGHIRRNSILIKGVAAILRHHGKWLKDNGITYHVSENFSEALVTFPTGQALRYFDPGAAPRKKADFEEEGYEHLGNIHKQVLKPAHAKRRPARDLAREGAAYRRTLAQLKKESGRIDRLRLQRNAIRNRYYRSWPKKKAAIDEKEMAIKMRLETAEVALNRLSAMDCRSWKAPEAATNAQINEELDLRAAEILLRLDLFAAHLTYGTDLHRKIGQLASGVRLFLRHENREASLSRFRAYAKILNRMAGIDVDERGEMAYRPREGGAHHIGDPGRAALFRIYERFNALLDESARLVYRQGELFGSAIAPQKVRSVALISVLSAPILYVAAALHHSVFASVLVVAYIVFMGVMPVFTAYYIEDAVSFRHPRKDHGLIGPFEKAENIRILETILDPSKEEERKILADVRGKISYFSYALEEAVRSGKRPEIRNGLLADKEALRRMPKLFQWFVYIHEGVIHGSSILDGRLRVKTELSALVLNFTLPWIAISTALSLMLIPALPVSDYLFLLSLVAYNVVVPALLYGFASIFGTYKSVAGHYHLDTRGWEHLGDGEIDAFIARDALGDGKYWRDWLRGQEGEDNVELIRCADRPDDILVIKGAYTPGDAKNAALLAHKIRSSEKHSLILIIADTGTSGFSHKERKARAGDIEKEARRAIMSVRPEKALGLMPIYRFTRTDVRSTAYDLTRLRELLMLYRRRLGRIEHSNVEREVVASEVHGNIERLKVALDWPGTHGYRREVFIGDFIGARKGQSGLGAIDMLMDHMASGKAPRVELLMGQTEHYFLLALLGTEGWTERWPDLPGLGGPNVMRSLKDLAAEDEASAATPRLRNDIKEAREFEELLAKIARRLHKNAAEYPDILRKQYYRFHPKLLQAAQFMVDSMNFVYFEDSHHNIYLTRAIPENVAWRGLRGVEAMRAMEDEFRAKVRLSLWLINMMRDIWLATEEASEVPARGDAAGCREKVLAILRDALPREDEEFAKEKREHIGLMKALVNGTEPGETPHHIFTRLDNGLKKATRPLPEIFNVLCQNEESMKKLGAVSPFIAHGEGGIEVALDTDRARQLRRIELGVNTVVHLSSFTKGVQELGQVRILTKKGELLLVSVDALKEGKVEAEMVLAATTEDEMRMAEKGVQHLIGGRVRFLEKYIDGKLGYVDLEKRIAHDGDGVMLAAAETSAMAAGETLELEAPAGEMVVTDRSGYKTTIKFKEGVEEEEKRFAVSLLRLAGIRNHAVYNVDGNPRITEEAADEGAGYVDQLTGAVYKTSGDRLAVAKSSEAPSVIVIREGSNAPVAVNTSRRDVKIVFAKGLKSELKVLAVNLLRASGIEEKIVHVAGGKERFLEETIGGRRGYVDLRTGTVYREGGKVIAAAGKDEREWVVNIRDQNGALVTLHTVRRETTSSFYFAAGVDDRDKALAISLLRDSGVMAGVKSLESVTRDKLVSVEDIVNDYDTLVSKAKPRWYAQYESTLWRILIAPIFTRAAAARPAEAPFAKPASAEGAFRKPQPPNMDRKREWSGADTVSDTDTANAGIRKAISEGNAVELHERQGRAVILAPPVVAKAGFSYYAEVFIRILRRLFLDALRFLRAPPLERKFRSEGTFARISSAKNTALLRKILREHSNFHNLTPREQGELIRTVQKISLSVVLGRSLLESSDKGEDIVFHVRTGFSKKIHGLEPTIWIGERLLERLAPEELARAMLEEAQHIVRPFTRVDGRWINLHWEPGTNEDPKTTVKHDDGFIDLLLGLAWKPQSPNISRHGQVRGDIKTVLFVDYHQRSKGRVEEAVRSVFPGSDVITVKDLDEAHRVLQDYGSGIGLVVTNLHFASSDEFKEIDRNDQWLESAMMLLSKMKISGLNAPVVIYTNSRLSSVLKWRWECWRRFGSSAKVTFLIRPDRETFISAFEKIRNGLKAAMALKPASPNLAKKPASSRITPDRVPVDDDYNFKNAKWLRRDNVSIPVMVCEEHDDIVEWIKSLQAGDIARKDTTIINFDTHSDAVDDWGTLHIGSWVRWIKEKGISTGRRVWVASGMGAVYDRSTPEDEAFAYGDDIYRSIGAMKKKVSGPAIVTIDYDYIAPKDGGYLTDEEIGKKVREIVDALISSGIQPVAVNFTYSVDYLVKPQPIGYGIPAPSTKSVVTKAFLEAFTAASFVFEAEAESRAKPDTANISKKREGVSARAIDWKSYDHRKVLEDRAAVLGAENGDPSQEALYILDHPDEAAWGENFTPRIYYELYSYLARESKSTRPRDELFIRLQRVVDAAVWNGLAIRRDSPRGEALARFYTFAEDFADHKKLTAKMQDLAGLTAAAVRDGDTLNSVVALISLCHVMHNATARFGQRIKDARHNFASGDEHEFTNPITALKHLAAPVEAISAISRESGYRYSVNTYLGTAYNLLTRKAGSRDDLAEAITNYKLAINTGYFKNIAGVFQQLKMALAKDVDIATADRSVVDEIAAELAALEAQGFPGIPEVRKALKLTDYPLSSPVPPGIFDEAAKPESPDIAIPIDVPAPQPRGQIITLSAGRKKLDDMAATERAIKAEEDRYIAWRNEQAAAGVSLPPLADISRKTSNGVWRRSINEALLLLDIAGAGAGTRILDIGSGDGRFDASIARMFGSEVTGFEIDPALAAESKLYASHAAENLNINISFEQADFRDKANDLSGYDILYYASLGSADYEELENMILANLKPGQRFIVFRETPAQSFSMLKERMKWTRVVEENGRILGTIYEAPPTALSGRGSKHQPPDMAKPDALIGEIIAQARADILRPEVREVQDVCVYGAHAGSRLGKEEFGIFAATPASMALHVINYIRAIDPGARICDLGSGNGAFCFFAAQYFGDVTGVEGRKGLHDDALNNRKALSGIAGINGVNFINEDFLTEGVDLSGYDVLYFFYTKPDKYETEEAWHAALREKLLSAKGLKPGAKLIILGGPDIAAGNEALTSEKVVIDRTAMSVYARALQRAPEKPQPPHMALKRGTDRGPITSPFDFKKAKWLRKGDATIPVMVSERHDSAVPFLQWLQAQGIASQATTVVNIDAHSDAIFDIFEPLHAGSWLRWAKRNGMASGRCAWVRSEVKSNDRSSDYEQKFVYGSDIYASMGELAKNVSGPAIVTIDYDFIAPKEGPSLSEEEIAVKVQAAVGALLASGITPVAVHFAYSPEYLARSYLKGAVFRPRTETLISGALLKAFGASGFTFESGPERSLETLRGIAARITPEMYRRGDPMEPEIPGVDMDELEKAGYWEGRENLHTLIGLLGLERYRPINYYQNNTGIRTRADELYEAIAELTKGMQDVSGKGREVRVFSRQIMAEDGAPGIDIIVADNRSASLFGLDKEIGFARKVVFGEGNGTFELETASSKKREVWKNAFEAEVLDSDLQIGVRVRLTKLYPDMKAPAGQPVKPQSAHMAKQSVLLGEIALQAKAGRAEALATPVGKQEDRIAAKPAQQVIRLSKMGERAGVQEVSRLIESLPGGSVILLAGPSCSGKTTITQLAGKELGDTVVHFELDRYYKDWKDIPRMADGRYDFDVPGALDIDLIEKHVKALLAGEPVDMPFFDTKTGHRKPDTTKVALGAGQKLVIEGILALDPAIKDRLNLADTYDIFINAVPDADAGLNGPVTSSDARLIRRIVRDERSRGIKALDTIRQWPLVQRGEETHIASYSGNADLIVDTYLPYEPSILKSMAMPLLEKAESEAMARDDAGAVREIGRLKTILKKTPAVGQSLVPEDSILREFIGNAVGASEEPVSPEWMAVHTVKVNSEIEQRLAALHDLFRAGIDGTSIRDGTRILLSENLFVKDGDESGLIQIRIALGAMLRSGYVEIMKPEEIRRMAMNRDVTKDKMAVVFTKEDFDDKEIWNGSDRQTSLRSSVLILDDKMTGDNYLYLEGVIGLARAVMARNRQAIREYYRLISGVAIDDKILQLLKDDDQNNVAFAIRAILKFRPIGMIVDSEEFNKTRIAMENALISA